MDKVQMLFDYLSKNNLDAILISNKKIIFDIINQDLKEANLLVVSDQMYLLSKNNLEINNDKIEVIFIEDDYLLTLKQLRKKHKIYKIGLEGDYISRNQWLDLQKHLNSRLIDINIDKLFY